MNRRSFLLRSTFGLAGATAASRLFAQAQPQSPPAAIDKIKLTPAEWRKKLTKDQYYILREEGTEPAGSSPLNAEKRKGTYVCAGCDLPLFKSETKYESGTGWPSFSAAIPGSVGTRVDYKIIVPRTEYHCLRCGGHQGHVFPDGPPPTGQRYCNNGVALKFVPA
jgi:peptide-methionine (R)-S-oxide reductase